LVGGVDGSGVTVGGGGSVGKVTVGDVGLTGSIVVTVVVSLSPSPVPPVKARYTKATKTIVTARTFPFNALFQYDFPFDTSLLPTLTGIKIP
jgi:hypothetical protein